MHIRSYQEVRKINNSPGHSRRATKDSQHDKPLEKEDQNISSPNTRIREPLSVFVQIRRWHCSYIHRIQKPTLKILPFSTINSLDRRLGLRSVSCPEFTYKIFANKKDWIFKTGLSRRRCIERIESDVARSVRLRNVWRPQRISGSSRRSFPFITC